MCTFDYEFLFKNHVYPHVTTLDFGRMSFSIQLNSIGNHCGIVEGQPYNYSIGHLYEYLKPETFPSLTTLDVHDFNSILFITYFLLF